MIEQKEPGLEPLSVEEQLGTDLIMGSSTVSDETVTSLYPPPAEEGDLSSEPSRDTSTELTNASVTHPTLMSDDTKAQA
jgi:hypothetical protein